MKALSITITFLFITINVVSQNNTFKEYIRLESGFGLNFCKNKIDQNSVWGDSKVSATPISRPGFNYYSNTSILLYKNFRINTGIDVTALNHSFKGTYSDLIDFTINKYQYALEIPLSISYELLKSDNGFLSLESGLKYTSLINNPTSPSYGIANSYDFQTSTSADIYGVNNAFVYINIPLFLRFSFYKKLNNNDYLKFFVQYLKYGSGMDYTIARYWVLDRNYNKIGGGEILGYYGNISTGVYYSFSFSRQYSKIYNQGILDGKKSLH